MICDSLQGIALPRLKYFHLFFNRISCCLGEVSLATAAWVAVGEIFLWNNPADREALGLSREGGEPLNKVAVATSYPISHPIPFSENPASPQKHRGTESCPHPST